jgi:NitT/TauT family transport system ATP-binding protein
MARVTMAADMPNEGTAPAAPVIEARGLDLTFQTADGPVQALRDVNLTINKGDFVSFIGPSGCGKTTFLRVVAALEHPTGGDDHRQRHDPGRGAAEPGLWLCVPGGGAVSVAHHREEHHAAAGDHGLRPGRAGTPREERPATRDLEGLRQEVPWQLSGGMQQRASIARALAFDADLLLMDEPFGALDEIVRDHLNEQLLALWARTEKTIGFVTHSIPEAVYLSTKIVVMSRGRAGSPT